MLNVLAVDDGQWARGRYRWNGRPAEVDAGDPLTVFKAAVRDAGLEEAASIAESSLGGADDPLERNPT